MKKSFLLSVITLLITAHSFALNHSGTITSNEVWYSTDNPHFITGNLIVASGVTLIIQAGCEIYFNGNYRFEVQGTLVADGTASSPIIFSSNKLFPAKGDWRFIYFNNPDAGSIMNYCEISYGGSLAARGMVSFRNASNGLVISNTTLNQSGSYGFEYRNAVADPSIISCTVTDCDKYPVYTYANRVKDLSGSMVFNNNVSDVIYVRSQTISTGTWSKFDIPYVIGGNITLGSGQTLTINPGVNLQFTEARVFNVNGTLIANGTDAERIQFTSSSLTPANGDWNRIHFNGAEAGTVLNYCDIWYAGSGTSAIDINSSGSNVTISNSTVKHSGAYGVFVRNGSSPKFINSVISHNTDIGFYITGASAPQFGANITEWNDIFGNGNYELRNGTLDIEARYIYWGVGLCGNVADVIYDNANQNNLGIVDFDPWVTANHELPTFITTWTGAVSPLWNDDANWDNGAPCETVSAIIPKNLVNQPIVVFSEVCDNLTIEGGGDLTIFSGASLQVLGDLSLEANALGTASLYENGGFSVAGNTTAQFYVTADRWHYLSPPMNNQTANTFFDMFLYDYNEGTDEWQNIIDPATPLPVGVGYKVWSSTINPPGNPPGTKSVDFVNGTLNSGNYFLPVTRIGNGWNMVGNPYPSAIGWSASGWIKSQIDATVYVWNGVQYITWNGSVGDLAGGIIPAMQGFMVKATGPNPLLVISNGTRQHGPDPYKSSPVDRLLEITVSGNGYSDKTFVNFNENATSGFDSEFDGHKLFGIEEAPQLYTRIGSEILSVNTLPEVHSGLFIPLSLEIPADEEYVFSFAGIQSFGEGVTVYLEDIRENQMVEVTQEGQYVFSAGQGDDPDRFILHFGVLSIAEENQVIEDSSPFNIYAYDQTIYIQQLMEQDVSGHVRIFSLLGQEITGMMLDNTPVNKIAIDSGSGYYVVQVISDSGVYSQKVYIR